MAQLETLPESEWVAQAVRLIATAIDEVVIFGGDLSWIDFPEMEVALMRAKRSVLVYHERKKGADPSIEERIQKLRDMKVKVERMNVKSGLRVVLVDPEDADKTRLLVIASPVDDGRSYSGFIAKHGDPEHGMMIKAIVALHLLNQELNLALQRV